MSSDWTPTWVHETYVVDDSLRLYPCNGGSWAYPEPTRCRNGHHLGPGTLVGTQACLAAPHGTHRTYRCEECGYVIFAPPEGDACEHLEFDGRGRRATS